MKHPHQEDLVATDVRSIANASQILKSTEGSSSAVVNHWIKNMNKWLSIISQWKKESQLIGRLVSISLLGEEGENLMLKSLLKELNIFVINDLTQIENKLLNMQRNIDLLRRYRINSDEKIQAVKVEIQLLSRNFTDLKSRILAELTSSYPATII